MILTIASRELRSLFSSPMAWVILTVVHVIMAYLFLVQMDFFLQVQARLPGMPGAPGMTAIIVVPLFANAAFVMLLVVPLITMRLISDERRHKTLALLFSSPVSMSDIILGKYLGVLVFLLIMLLLLLLMPLLLLLGGRLDMGVLMGCVLGLFLLMLVFAAVGLFMSTYTRQATVAAVGSFGLLLFLWMLDWRGNESAAGLIQYLSLVRHYEPLLKGVFDSRDVVYFLLLATVFIIASIRRLEALRWTRH